MSLNTFWKSTRQFGPTCRSLTWIIEDFSQHLQHAALEKYQALSIHDIATLNVCKPSAIKLLKLPWYTIMQIPLHLKPFPIGERSRKKHEMFPTKKNCQHSHPLWLGWHCKAHKMHAWLLILFLHGLYPRFFLYSTSYFSTQLIIISVNPVATSFLPAEILKSFHESDCCNSISRQMTLFLVFYLASKKN